ncbi:Bug family tripartite tricarboxylate transporter substrate binding protein [Pseudorhodoferax sp.]|uniref:Bug family tripartite tricarboxylate transporter substrate binding protein n=1 Tax=Pseudorhodoferax sp. TaxID=1993553 RepID=UPI002DD6610B|nr:tripartite tricarboxylate transporter substrate binding protein [Pseudorhodoferax sp.]
MRRRTLLARLATPTLLALPAFAARAQAAYPNKPIKLLIGFAPGGGLDFTARTIQPGLEAALGQSLVIDYKPGAGGVIAATELARTAADGYTLLVANTGPFAIAPYLRTRMPYDPVKDFSYIGQISEAPYIVATRADHPAKDLKQFVEWAKGQAGKANFASSGIGASTHLNGELFNSAAGVDLLHVPYKGSSPAVTDLIAGQVQLLIDAGTVLLPHVKSGKLRALATTGKVRDATLPDVPTAIEQGFPGLESSGFQGLVGPAGLPREVVERLGSELRKVLAGGDVKAKFTAAGSEVHYRTPAEFAAHVKAEAEKWSALIRTRKLQID